nr:transporter substrate-binding domain-containing protein [Lachnospiraceae bacterium]
NQKDNPPPSGGGRSFSQVPGSSPVPAGLRSNLIYNEQIAKKFARLIKDGNNVGYDIDIVVNFCRDRGYALELLDADFSGRIPSVQSGRCDFCTGMNVTEERKEQVLF